MHEYLSTRTVVSVLPTPTGAAGGPVDFNATGDKFIFTPAKPSKIVRWGLIFIDAVDPDAGGFVLALDYRPTAGSDTNRSEEATITRANADTSAAGAVIYNEVTRTVASSVEDDGSTLNVAAEGPLLVIPGTEAVIEVTNAAGVTATGYVWIEYLELPFAGANVEDAIEVTS